MTKDTLKYNNMASICTLRDYVLAPAEGLPGIYWVWDKELKFAFQRPYSSIDNFFELETGAIVDVITSEGLIALVTKLNSSDPVSFVQLFSTSGDPYNTLLSAKVVDGILTIIMYATTAKETTTLTFPMQTMDNASPPNEFVPCFNDYEIVDDVIITAWCDAYTLNEIVTEDGTAILRQTVNSVTCGYSAPIEPFRFSEQKKVEYRSCVLSNPVMFVWKNALGGWDYWLFQKTQIETLDTDTLGSFAKNYSKISDIKNPFTERGKSGSPKITFGASDLREQDKVGLKGLLLSNKVYILNQDNSINRDVKVMTGTYLMNRTQTLEFQIEDVEINTIRN